MAFRLFMKLCVFTQQHRGKCLAGSSLGLFAVNVFYHVFPEQTFRELYQEWYKGERTALSDRLRAQFRDVLDETRLDSSGFTPFAAYGFQIISAGVPWLPGGCLIGVPTNYNSRMEDGTCIADRVVLVNGQEVDWTREPGISLQDSLTLSVNAQKFSMAREALHAQTGGPILRASVAPLSLTAVCVSAVAVKQHLGLYSRPILFRGFYNVLIVLLGLTGYCLGYDMVSQFLDYKADRKAAAISKAYARGGLELYEKILAHNKLLRGIFGKKGETTYASNGNLFPGYLRQKHASYTSRRDRIKHALEKRQE
ncbi:transmembrane protein 177 [Eleutherodactylus coqui]|uniref:Transmembrane protein 177 n=1 Tax=Eleutherodactylus coqui TaxID=57060 RepID=A0A8J6EIM5_ELECQ|nr:hypothetical protein GDO78_019365 [Eleutherodactylus coqui]